MNPADWFAGFVGAAAGGSLVWFCKDTLLKWWQGASTFAKNLEAKAAAIKSAVGTTTTPPAAK